MVDKAVKKRFKKELKKIIKDIKAFREIANTDFKEGLKQSKDIVELIRETLYNGNYNTGFEKEKKELVKTLEGLNIYMSNITELEKFNKKWE